MMTCFLLLIKTLIKPRTPMLGAIHHQPVKGHREDLFSGSGEQPVRYQSFTSQHGPQVYEDADVSTGFTKLGKSCCFKHYSPCRDAQTAHKRTHVVLHFNQLPSNSFTHCWPVKRYVCERRSQKRYKEKSCVHVFTVGWHTLPCPSKLMFAFSCFY